MSCLGDEQALSFARGHLAAADRAALEAHLDGCPACRSLVAELARLEQPAGQDASQAAERTPMPRIAPGERIGRYVVARVLGAGTAGIVYEGEDPDLGRNVAIKVLRPAKGTGERAERERLLREARAMARLSHPNVVTVHDVGTQGECVYLVRECVDGESLDVWLRTPRSWRAVLDVFVAAGRGLASAHKVGIVHQDFKPENVLVGRDGSVRVADFGMAVGVDEPAAERAGTPAFMAPEQGRQSGSDPRADQFSFCVALWWALYGRHPFRAPTAAVGPIDRAASGRVPPAIAAALQRGLQLDPRARHPTLTSLLDELLVAAGAAPPPRARVWKWSAAALAGVTIAAVLLARRGPPRAPRVTSVCDLTNVDDDEAPCLQTITEPRPWAAAQETCRAFGGHLVTCVSNEECERLSTRAPMAHLSWIGLKNTPRERAWQWSTGEPLTAPLSQRWAEPPADRVGCGALAPGSSGTDRRWTVESCERALPALCEQHPWRVSAAGRAYRVLPTPMTWQDARRACQRWSADLAVVTSDDEQRFVEHAVFERGSGSELTLWLGGTDTGDEGRFRWVSGEPFSFRAFHPQEPDNRDGAQNCLVLQAASRRWHDRDCAFRYPALCERAR